MTEHATSIAVAVIAAVPPTLVALATLWHSLRHARKTDDIHRMTLAAEDHHREVNGVIKRDGS